VMFSVISWIVLFLMAKATIHETTRNQISDFAATSFWLRLRIALAPQRNL
jgi:hypothetical protein